MDGKRYADGIELSQAMRTRPTLERPRPRLSDPELRAEVERAAQASRALEIHGLDGLTLIDENLVGGADHAP